jgi:hypothetical protein
MLAKASAMRDLELWRLLKAGPGPALPSLLDQLAQRDLADRVPYLGLLARILRDGDSQNRASALRALKGAAGTAALQMMVDGFSDPDFQVVETAVASFSASLGQDRARWAHAVFHPDPRVRALAAASPDPIGLNLFLVSDPLCRDRLCWPRQAPKEWSPAILEWVQQGVLQPTSARALLDYRHACWLLEQPGARVEQCLALFWNEEPPAPYFWDKLRRWLEARDREPHRQRVCDLLVNLSAELGGWPRCVADQLFRLDPARLVDQAIPRSIRYQGLAALYHGLHPSWNSLLAVAQSDLMRSEGKLDLWALGAVLFACSKPDRLLQRMDPSELKLAALHRPSECAFPLLSPNFKEGERSGLADLLDCAEQTAAPVAAGLMAGGDFRGSAPVLRHTPEAVARVLFELDMRAGFRVSPAIREKLLDHLVQALRKAPQVLLRAGRGDLARGALVCLAERLGPENFSRHAMQLEQSAFLSLLQTIDDTPAFPYPVEEWLALELSGHPLPAAAAWARARERTAPASGRLPPADLVFLTDGQLAAIADCPEAELQPALQPALSAPTSGLLQAVSRREPGHHQALVARALLGSHDPVEGVAAELERFGGATSELALHWSYQPALPLLGHCFLDRFDFHTDLVEEQVPNLDALVELAGRLSGSAAQAIWGMLARLCSRWRFREPGKLQDRLHEGTVSELVEALAGSCALQAATCLARVWQSQTHRQVMEGLRPRVQEMLPDLAQPVRVWLHEYASSKGLLGGARSGGPSAGRRELEEIGRLTNLEQLAEALSNPSSEIASAAGLRLLDFAETGASILLQALLPGGSPHAAVLAETASFWPEGPSRRALEEGVLGGKLDPEVAFFAGLSLCDSEAANSQLLQAVLEAACRPTTTAWFRSRDWQRLLDCGLSPSSLSLELAASPHPHAYVQAVKVALQQSQVPALVSFLEAGSDRHAETRLKAARWLWAWGDTRGFPILFQAALADEAGTFPGNSTDLAPAVESVFLTGAKDLISALVGRVIQLGEGDSESFEQAAPIILRRSRQPEICQAILAGLPRTRRRQEMLVRVARSFAWGVTIGRRLTGRLFAVEMHGGERLGFTRLEESRIFVNPLPMFRGERHGQEIVEGLILHELGHHLYHRGSEEKKAWEEAEREGIFPLLNLVSDEHLERNLRTLEASYDQKLKRLGAYAFLHSRREVPVVDLLVGLQHRALAVLSGSQLKVAHQDGCVSLRSGEVFAQIEKEGSSFMRFLRGLRMGWGNRSGDPKVAEALSLFSGRFRHLRLPEQLPIARRLREIFGHEVALLRAVSQEAVFRPDRGEVVAVGEGLTAEEMRREVERMTRERSANPNAPARDWINVCPDPSFPAITNVVPIPYDPVATRAYASEVIRHSHPLREVFRQLGLCYESVGRRVKGHRLDRPRLPAALTRGDLRILQARRLVVRTDLFLGLVVDCSGSMRGTGIHKARLFATLIAQACRDLPGVDLRVLGFTDSVIYDAGGGARCAAASLQADGGNNDAGALAYAASLARSSRRRAKLLIMISDGLPTECSVTALRDLVSRLTRREGVLCAQVAVRPLQEVCFPHYIELLGDSDGLGPQVAAFGRVVARLVRRSMA